MGINWRKPSRFFKGSLRVRAIAWFFLPTAIILVAVVLVNFFSYQEVTEDLVIERGQDVPRFAASRLAADLEEYTNLLADLARDAASAQDSPTAHEDVLDRAQGKSLVFDSGILVLDTFGQVVATQPNFAERLGQDWSDRSYFREMVRNQSVGYSSRAPIFTNIIDDRQAAGVIAVAVPVLGGQGEFTWSSPPGVNSVNSFYGRIAKLRIGAGSTYLVDGNGRVVYHSKTDLIGGDFSKQPAVQQLLAKQAGNMRTQDLDGVDIVASFAPVPGTPWGLVTEEKWSSLIATSQGYQRFLLLLLALGVAVPVMFVIVGVRRIMRPLKDLILATRQVASGDFSEPIAVQSGDEIKELAEEFNTMAEALKDSHAAMETRVADARLFFALATVAALQTTNDEILQKCLDMVCEYVAWPIGHLYVTASDGTDELEPTSIWHLDKPEEFEVFRDVTMHTRFAPGVGLPGRVLESGEPAWIPNVQEDQNFPRNKLADDIGVCGAFGIPVRVRDETVAVLEFFTETIAERDEHVLDVMRMVGFQFGRILDRRRVEEALQRAHDELERRVADRTVELTATNESLEETNQRLEETLAELRSTQERMIQQERLKALGTMASGIAHDFNNALGSILGYSDVLLTFPETLDDNAQTTEYIRTINTSAKDAAAVVDRLREFYRHRDDGEVLQPIDVNSVVREAISMSQPRWKGMAQAEGVDIELRTELASDIPQIGGNESNLRSALTNLIFNAVDAMPEGGTLTISTDREDGWVRIVVVDTGTGMSEETKSRALEPFFSTKEERGTGLGLATVFGIVSRHGGRIDFTSELGKGTEFTVLLPLPRSTLAAKDDPEDQTMTRTLHILVAEDEPKMQRLLSEYLTRDGHTVELAPDGVEALRKFSEGDFDLVITDRGMPNMNGDELAVAIRAGSEVPIIMATGFGGMMLASGERPVGVDFTLGKPIAIAALRKAINSVIKEI